jgi:hypothetical protein
MQAKLKTVLIFFLEKIIVIFFQKKLVILNLCIYLAHANRNFAPYRTEPTAYQTEYSDIRKTKQF